MAADSSSLALLKGAVGKLFIAIGNVAMEVAIEVINTCEAALPVGSSSLPRRRSARHHLKFAAQLACAIALPLAFASVILVLPLALASVALALAADIDNIPHDESQGDTPRSRKGAVLLLIGLIVLGATVFFREESKLGKLCSSDASCGSGLSCQYCWMEFTGRCVRSTVADPFKIADTSLPFNKYAFLTTHNSFSIGEPSHNGVPRFPIYNQDDSVTDQLNNGVRALMLDVYDFRDDIWLCHTMEEICRDFTAFRPVIDTMREIEAFLSANPSEIVTLILEDHVRSHHGLSKLFKKAGLMKYWFPVSKMPKNGEDWPLVRDMIKLNHRLLVFTSVRSKESSEQIAYQWNYMVENQYGYGGMYSHECYNRSESPVLSDRTKSLVLVNYFGTIPFEQTVCMEHKQEPIMDVLRTCYTAADNRWANFFAVDYYKRSNGGGVLQATDMLNGMLICGRNDVRACRKRTIKEAFYNLFRKLRLMWRGSEQHYGGGKVVLSDRDQNLDNASAQGLEQHFGAGKATHNDRDQNLETATDEAPVETRIPDSIQLNKREGDELHDDL